MQEQTLSETVQKALKGELARHDMSRRMLARRLGHSNDWTSRRISGEVAITLDDLDAMCRELELEPVIKLRPVSARAVSAPARKAAPKKTTAGGSSRRRSRTPQPPSGEGSER